MAKPFEAEQTSFDELMRSNGQNAYAIPLYQRRYVWKNEQNSKLWDDIKTCNEERTNHFLGSIVLIGYEKDEYDKKNQSDELIDNAFVVRHVVDGQQRLTSLALLLAALRQDMLRFDPLFNRCRSSDEQSCEDWNTLKTDIRDCLLTRVRDRSSESGKGYIPRIIPVRSIYEAYKEMLNGERCGRQLLVHKAYLLQMDNIEAYRKEKLVCLDDGGISPTQNDAEDVYDFYNQLYTSITMRVKFIRIECAAEEDAFQVFESLNGTGLSLTSADRIKNLLMGKAAREQPPVPISKIESSWQEIESAIGGPSHLESFISSYMFTRVNRRVSKRELTSVFNKAYLSGYSSMGKVLHDLKHVAECYGTIVMGSPYTSDDGSVRELAPSMRQLLDGIRDNNPSQSIVPLLAAAVQYGFDDSNFDLIARRLRVLLVRHKVCQKSTNILDKYFEEYCAKIRSEPVVDVIRLLKSQQQNDIAFEMGFSELTFESGSRSEYSRARYYLRSIENYLRNKSGDGPLAESEDVTLEHIIPQAFDSETWFENEPEIANAFLHDEDNNYRELFVTSTIQSIGNMCLLRRPENSSAGNRRFESKIAAYSAPDVDGKTAKDTFCLVSQIVSNVMRVEGDSVAIVEKGKTFDAESAARRAKVLAKYALEIWK